MQLQGQSIKIKKKRTSLNPGECNFLCGGCQSAYRSYPALYLHIKRKHNGIKPPNTKTARLSDLGEKGHSRRPNKPSHHIDDIDDYQMQVEQLQSEFLGFLGENLKIVCFMNQKPKLQDVVIAITSSAIEAEDEAITQMKIEIESLSQELTQGEAALDGPELDFDTFPEMKKANGLRILCWFLLWLGKYFVKIEALKDMFLIFAKIWAVLNQKQLNIQDLDNKIVWNGVMKECEHFVVDMIWFEGKKELVYDFISRVCHLIGKIFE